MQKQQLISIKDAATSTGVSEDDIRKHIRSGKIGGEKKNYIFWDEWFVTQKDLAKIRDSINVSDAAELSIVPPGSQARALQAARRAGVGGITDNGIRSKFNYSWMPNMSIKHETEQGQTHEGAGLLPPSLAAEIERAFSPDTASDAFGARAYLQKSGDQSTNSGVAEDTDDSDAPDVSSNNDFVGRDDTAVKLAMFRQAARKKKAAAADQSQAGLTDTREMSSQPAPSTDYRTIAKTVAEEFLAPLLHRLEVQAAQLHEKDLLIADQAAQLRLLPDFQRQSEEARRLAEKKQQEALQLRQNLSWERKKALIKISAWQMKNVKIERQLKHVEQKVSDIQEQKESEVNYLHCQLTQLQEQLTAAQKPWWKKIFGA